MIKRAIENSVRASLFKGKTIVIYGPRQVGKTTLCKAILSDCKEKSAYFSCDLPEVQRLLQNPTLESFKRFVSDYRLIVLDEGQRIEGIGIALKILHEHFPETQFIVTGSSSFELGQSIQEPMTGRKNEFLLYPISISELAPSYAHPSLIEMIPFLMRYGAYPEVIHSSNPSEIIDAVANDYLFKDILALENFKSVSVLRSLLEAIALQLGNEVSMNELSSLVGVTRATIERYLDLLERSFIIFRLRALSRNPRKEIAKNKKIYFYDLGVRNSLIKNFNDLSLRADTGALWENFCLIERMKFNRYTKRSLQSWFWRTYDHQEIDYIEEQGGQFEGFEFKWKSTKNPRAFHSFEALYPNSKSQIISRESFWNFVGL